MPYFISPDEHRTKFERRRRRVTGAPQLPTDILANIFILLKLNDRKNVRLTCRTWYAECHRPNITAKEKFVFRYNDKDDMRGLGRRITGCSTLRECFEFQGLPLHELHTDVWQLCGERIKILYIYDCQVNNDTIVNIITYCPNMTHLCLQSSQECRTSSPLEIDRHHIFCSERAFDRLILCGIERRQLVSLKLYISVRMSEEMLRKIFQIYPCVRMFGHGCWPSKHSSYIDSPSNSSSVREWILPPKIETFISNNWITESWRMPEIKFKELAILLNIENAHNLGAFGEFFSKQTKLKKLTIRMETDRMSGRSSHVKSFILHVLRSSDALRKFDVTIDSLKSNIKFNVLDYGKLIKRTRQLQTLILENETCFEADNSFPRNFGEISSARYTALTKLHLTKMDCRIIFDILSRCTRSLVYLSVEKANVEILQQIFKMHTELKTLRISLGARRFTDDIVADNNGSSSEHRMKYSIRRLECLRCLQFWNISTNELDDIVSEFNSPNLRYFRFNLRVLSPVDDFRETARIVQLKTLDILSLRAPSLEVLKIQHSILGFSRLSIYCKRLTNLRLLILDNDLPYISYTGEVIGYSTETGNLRKLFLHCPSLCWVKHSRFEFSYSFDRHSYELEPHTHKYFDDSIHHNYKTRLIQKPGYRTAKRNEFSAP